MNGILRKTIWIFTFVGGLLWGSLLFGQTVQKVNVTTCKGEPVTLSAGGGDLYSWSDGSIGQTLTATVSTETKYTATVSTVVPNSNLVVNGDFGAGYTVGEFNTGYNYNCRTGGTVGDLNNGCIFIGPDANLVHSAFVGLGHGTAPDNFLIVNGAPNIKLWEQTIAVQPNTTYAFSCWASTLTQPTKLKFSINSTQLGQTFAVPGTKQTWNQFFILWNSGTATTAVIEIMDVQTSGFDDFGIDDISFAPVTSNVIEYTVKPIECTVTVPTCANETITLKRNDGVAYKWSDNSTKDTLRLNAGSAAQQVKVTVTAVPDNLVANGDFSSTVPNFTTGYGTYVSVPLYDGQYWIGANAHDVHWAFVGYDHTVGDGVAPHNFLVVNGDPGTLLWQQTIPVVPGTRYAFSCWVSTLTAPTRVQFSINGAPLGAIFDGPALQNEWKQFYIEWTADAPSAKIEIIDRQTGGNDDFGIDDISLAPVKDMVFTYNINPSPCDIDIVNNDTAICRGDSVELHVRTTGKLVGWSPDSVINRPSLADSWAKPLTTNTYTATAKFLKNNLITNGDFEAGNAGFTTDYTLNPSSSVLGSGKYFIYTNARYGSTTWPRSFGDHTSGSGYMMVFDGDAVGGKRAYSTSVYVSAGTKYLFSTWIKNVHSDLVTNPPLLVFNVDGTDLGQIKFPAKEPDWISFSTPYVATKSGWITIDIRNKNTNANRNDFALDDIFFGEYVEKTDKVTVTVKPLPTAKLRNDTTIFAGTPLKIDAGTGAVSYEWNVPTPHATTQTISVTNAGTYIVTVTTNGCTATDTVVVKEKFGELAYYRFCGCSLNDYTGNGYNATLFGPPNPTCVNSIYDQGYHFAGDIDEYIRPMNLPEITQSFSMMAWIKPEGYYTTNVNPILTQGLTKDFITLWMSPTSLNIVLNWGTTEISRISAPASFVTGQYYHVAATYDFQLHTVNLYLNGVLIGSGTYFYPIQTANEGFYIGSSYAGTDEYFIGTIDEVRLFNKPLSAAQIDSIYQINNKTKIDLGKDLVLENGQTKILTAPNGFSSYLWQNASTSKTQTVSNYGKYIVSVTDAGLCKYIDSVKIRIKYFDTLTYTICQGSQYTLRAAAADTILWQDGANDLSKTLTATANSQTWVEMISDTVITHQEFIINTISCTLTVNDDITICSGDSARLDAATTGRFTGWHPGSVFKDSMKLASNWIKPSTTSSYSATAMFPQNNLLMNGDFERGNVGFKTDYKFTTSITPGEYFVGTTPYNSFTSGWARDFGDHTTGTGKMLVVDGDAVPGARVYYANMFVIAGAKYVFSVWAKGVHQDAGLNPAKLRFYVGNDALGAIDYPKNVTTWVQFSTVWTAKTTGNIEISIKNQSIASMGNDFALDDIQFGEFTEISKTVNITVNQRPDISLGPDIKVCSNDSVALHATSTATISAFNWSASTNTSDTMQVWKTGEYRVSVTANGCINTDTIKVTIDSVPSIELGVDWAIDCKASSPRMLDAGKHAYYGWSTGATTQTIVPSIAGKYIAEVSTAAGCKARDSVNIGYKCDGPKFNCNGNFYLSTTLSNNTKLSEVKFSGSGVAAFIQIGALTNINYNAIGFNYVNNYIYGYNQTDKTIIQIFADGTYSSIGQPVGLPTNDEFYMADCDRNGNFVLVGKAGDVYVIDVLGVYPKIIATYTLQNIVPATSTTNNNVADVAIHPLTGLLYYFSSIDRSLYKTDINTGIPQKVSINPSSNISMLTAIWFDSFGNIYGYGSPNGSNNQTTLFKINSSTGADQLVANGPIASGTDGCSCAYFVDMYKTPDKKIVHEGDTVLYTFAISNSTRSIQKDYTFIDSLPKGMKYIEVPTTILGVTPMVSTVDGRDILKADKTIIPEGIVRFSVKVKVLCVDANTTTANVARIPDLPALIGGPVASDDSTTIEFNDPATVDVLNYNLPTASVDKAEICAGDVFTLTGVSAATTVSWFGPNSFTSTGLIATRSQTDSTMSGTYRFASTNNGCTDTAKTTVLVHALPRVTASASPAAICKGASTKVIGAGATSYVWDQSIIDNTDFTPTATTTYNVTGTDANGCQDTSKVTVTVRDLPIVTASASPAAICKGASTKVIGAGATSYVWDQSIIDNTDFTPSATTTYNVTGTDANGCKDTSKVTVTVYNLPIVTASASPAAICKGKTTKVIGAGATSYVWDNAVTDNTDFTPSATITYNVTGTDGNNCTNTAQVTVTVHDLPNVTASANPAVICKDKTTKVIGAGATSYVWDNAVIDNTDFTPSATKTYKVTGTDGNNCTNTTQVTVTVNDLPVVTASANPAVICKGKTTKVIGAGATSYVWDQSIIDNTDFTPSATTTYNVTGTDGNNCTNTTQVTVTVNDLPIVTASASPAAICKGKTTKVIGAGATSYVWDQSIIDNTDFTPSATTTYNVTGTDANGCQDTSKVSVTVNDLPIVTASASPAAICKGKTTKVIGAGATSYVWDNAVIDNTDFTPSATATYQVTGTDGNNCTNTAQVSVTVNPLPTPTITASADAVCLNKKITLSTQSYKTYQWSSLETSPSITIDKLGLHNITLTVTDVNDCKASASKTVEVYPLPAPNIVSDKVGNKMCDGETITFTLDKVYSSYLWSNNATSNSISLTQNAPVLVTVTDANGCPNATSASFVINDLPQITLSSPPKCDKAVLTPKVTNVVMKSFTWNTGEVANSKTFTTSGASTSFNVTVTAESIDGCKSNETRSFVLYKTPHPILKPTDSVCEESSISISETSGEALNQQYSWFYRSATTKYAQLTGETSSILTNRTKAGWYTVIANNNTCQDSAVIKLIVNPLPIVNATGQNICFNSDFQPIIVKGKTVDWFEDAAGTIPLQQSDTVYTPHLATDELSRTLYVRITDQHNCVSHLLPIEVKRIPEYKGLSILGDAYRCASEKLGEKYIVKGTRPGDKVKWTSTQTAQQIVDSIISVTGFVPGVDTVKVAVGGEDGCIYSVEKAIFTSPQPRADFEWSNDNRRMTVAYNNTSDSAVVPEINQKLGNKYKWSFWKVNDFWRNATFLDSTLNYPYGYHDVRLVVTNEYGCVDSIRKTVFVDINPELYIPTVFAPDNESKEIAEFRPKGMNLDFYEVYIYDQWGNMLWFSNKLFHGHPFEGWDGTYQGNTMKGDVYIWKIRARFSNGSWWRTDDESKYEFGNIILLR